ncbi:hypothetical protein C8Q72DRAFT_795013 [Fomitopsis betulina]|nr:hypothetical protein C8Q72DRAFT_795013 [Fomitopsis betulina]
MCPATRGSKHSAGTGLVGLINVRNERPQMTKWLEWREKIAMFESLCLLLYTSDADADADEDADEDADAQTPSISMPTSAPPPPPPKTSLFLPKHPSSARQSIHAIANRHCTPGFTKALNQHVYSMKLGRLLTSQEQENASSYLPFSRIDTFHTLKFTTIPLTDNQPEHDVVKARPLHTDGTPAGEIIPLSMIRQSYSVLDKAQKFLLNNWASKYSYQTLW